MDLSRFGTASALFPLVIVIPMCHIDTAPPGTFGNQPPAGYFSTRNLGIE